MQVAYIILLQALSSYMNRRRLHKDKFLSAPYGYVSSLLKLPRQLKQQLPVKQGISAALITGHCNPGLMRQAAIATLVK